MVGKRNWLLIGAWAGIAASTGIAEAQDTQATPAGGKRTVGPKYVCEQPTFDFGEAWAGARIEHKFAVRNDGDQDLQILEAKPACSCTLVPDFQRIIKPGQTAMLPAILDTRHKHDTVEAALSLTTNQTGVEREKQLRIVGKVRTVCQMSPIGQNFFYNVQDGQPVTKEIKLVNTSGQSLILELIPPRPTLPFKVSLKETKPKQEYVAVVTAVGPFKEGATQEIVEFKTNIPEAPIYRLELSATVPPRIMVNPPWMGVNGQQREGQSRPLIVMNNGTEPFDITGMKASQPFLHPQLMSKEENRWNFTVLIPSFYRPPPQGEQIVFYTTDKQKPELVVRVVAIEVPPPIELVPEEFRERLQGIVTDRGLPTPPAAGGS